MTTNDVIMPKEFLSGFHDVCDPPFCFRCGQRRGRCECKSEPMTKSEWIREWKRRDEAVCSRCDGDGKANGADRPFEWQGPGTYPGPCPVCKGTGEATKTEES